MLEDVSHWIWNTYARYRVHEISPCRQSEPRALIKASRRDKNQKKKIIYNSHYLRSIEFRD